MFLIGSILVLEAQFSPIAGSYNILYRLIMFRLPRFLLLTSAERMFCNIIRNLIFFSSAIHGHCGSARSITLLFKQFFCLFVSSLLFNP